MTKIVSNPAHRMANAVTDLKDSINDLFTVCKHNPEQYFLHEKSLDDLFAAIARFDTLKRMHRK
jgi:hypothetical protein